MPAQGESCGPLLMRVLPQTSRDDTDLSNLLEMRPQKIYRPNSRSISQPSNPAAVSGRPDVRRRDWVSPHCLQAAARQLWALKVR